MLDTHRAKSSKGSINIIETSQTAPNTPYSWTIGYLMYLDLGTRQDILFAVNRFAQYCESPLERHWKAVRRMFRYINRTKGLGITLSGGSDLEIV